MRLVKNNKIHWEFIRNLRNNEQVKKGFINQEYITREAHKKYMRTHWRYYFVCTHRGKRVGYIGVVDNDIRIAVLPEEQGKGFGRFMLTRIKWMRPAAFGKVKIDNIASQHLFLAVGYKEITRTREFIFYTNPKR